MCIRDSYATASISYDGSVIVPHYVNAALSTLNPYGQLVNPYSFNNTLATLDYLSILDLSDQLWTPNGANNFLDLKRNRSIRVVLAKNNPGLKAIHFVSHSLLKQGTGSPQAADQGGAGLTINVSGSIGFEHFIVNDEAHSSSLMWLDANGYITPTKAVGNWNIAVIPDL